MLMAATEDLAGAVGVAPACESLGVARSTLYYQRQPKQEPKPRPKPGLSLQVDRGKIAKRDSDNCEWDYNLSKTDIEGITWSFNAEVLFVGFEYAQSLFSSSEVVTLKGGPRASALKPGVNLLLNYTIDIPWF